MIGIAVCDDDKKFSERMKLLIEQYFTEQSVEINVSVFNSGADFLSDNTDYNAVFLDIDIPDMGGFEIAEQLSEDTLIVFVTTHDELVYSSLKFRPFRFIRKTYLEEELPEALEEINKEIAKRGASSKFVLQTKNGEALLNVSNIKYIEIYTHSIRVYTVSGEILECYGSLAAMEKQLKDCYSNCISVICHYDSHRRLHFAYIDNDELYCSSLAYREISKIDLNTMEVISIFSEIITHDESFEESKDYGALVCDNKNWWLVETNHNLIYKLKEK